MNKIRCRECGWVGYEDELPYVTVYEDYGDVSTVKCAGCGAILYEGMDFDQLFENVTGKEL